MNLKDIFKTSGRININSRTLVTPSKSKGLRASTRVTYAFLRVRNRLIERRGDEFGEKAVILGLVVIVGIAAWGLFGQKVVTMINSATAGM